MQKYPPNIVMEWKRAIVFLDLQRAFETTDCDLLLKKLNRKLGLVGYNYNVFNLI